MTVISINVNFEEKWDHEIEFKYENRKFDAIRIKSWKGSTITMTALKEGIPYCTIQKRLSLSDTDNTFHVKFGKKVLTLGTYELIEN